VDKRRGGEMQTHLRDEWRMPQLPLRHLAP